MVWDFAWLLVLRVGESKDGSQVVGFLLVHAQDFLAAFRGLDLAELVVGELGGDLIKVVLFLLVESLFQFGSQVALTAEAFTVADGEFGFFAFEYEG